MAEGTWEVKNGELIYSIGGSAAVKIWGGLNEEIVQKDVKFVGDEADLIDDYLGTVTDPTSAADHGVITLKKAALGTSTADITLTTLSGISSYKLALEGGVSFIRGDDVAAKWTLVNGTASYFAAGTPENWSLGGNSTKITYTAAVQNDVLAAITGMKADVISTDPDKMLKRYVTVAEAAAGASKGTITFAEDVLDRSSTISLVEGSDSYALALAAGIGKFDDNPDDQIATLAMSGTSAARITRTRVGGWLIAGGSSSISFHGTDTKLLASIAGLSDGALASYLSLGTKDSLGNSVITLQKLALGTDSEVDVILTDEDTSDKFTFELGLTGGGSKLGFEEISPYWSVSGASAIYQKSTKEGWTLSGTSIVSYTPQEDPTMLATITNLSGIELGSNSTITGITVVGNVITLARNVLNTNPSAAIALEIGDDQNFSLALAGGILQEPEDLGNSLSFATAPAGAASTSATIFKTYSEAWSVSGASNNKIVYTGASSKVLATINGLSIGALSGTDISMSGDGSNILITLQQRALRAAFGESGAVTLIDNNPDDGIYFSLSLAGDVSKPDVLTGNPYLSIVSGSGGMSMANIVHNRLAGWTLSGASKNKIVYTGGESIVLATIEGLSNLAASGTNIFLGEKDATGKSIITLDRDALVAQSGVSVMLTDRDEHDAFTFALALSGGVSSPGTEFKNWSLSVANGAASVIANKHEGWTLAADEDKITYTPEQIGIFAKIAGLSTGALSGVNIHLGEKDDYGKSIITLGTSALIAETGASVVLTDTTGDEFTFALALSGVSSPATDFTNASLDLSSISSTGIASISGTKSAGWTLAGDSNSVSYVAQSAATLGTIKGLSLGASTAIEFDSLTNVIKLKNGSLSKTNISLESKYDAFSLSLASDIVNYNGGGSVGFRPIYYWEKNSGNTTAYYKVDTSEGWTLAGNSKGVTYKAESHDEQIVATITNLQRGFASASGVIDGISVSAIAGGGSVITLSKNVLGVGDPMQLKNRTEFGGGVANYSLSLNADSNVAGGSVPTAGVSTFAWTTLGTTARYSKIETAYWTLGDDEITYTPQQNNDIVATLTGLNSAVQEADMTIAGESNADGTYEIMLNKNALAGRNVTLAGTSYVLTLNRSTAVADRKKKVDAPTLSGGKWEINRTTATYKVTLTDGYEVSNDGTTVIHTTAGETALLTITGLKSGLTVNAYGEISGIKIGTLSNGDFTESTDGTGTVIQLSEEVLGTGTVAINGTGLGANYTLVLDKNVMTETKATAAKGDVWRVDGTTAVYKEITPAYYTLERDSKSITYTAEADTAGGTKAKVTGLKSGLSVGTDGAKTWVGVATTLDGVTTVAPDLEIDSSDDNKINLTKDVLTNSDVKVEGDSYVLYLGDIDTVNSLKPVLQTGTLSFVQDGTTETKAYLKGTMSEGYLVESGDKKILYKAQNTAYTLATIEGLKTGLSTSDFTGNNAGLKLAGSIITVSAKMLGDTSVTINNGKDHEDNDYNYEFALDSDVVTTDNAGTKDVWAADTSDKTKYIYKTIVPTHYALNTSKSNQEITRTAENAGTTLVTLSGLKSDLYIDDETRQLEGITVTEDTGDPSKTIIKLSGDVLNEGKDATYNTTATNYTVEVDADIKPVNLDPYWTVSGTTATYQYDTTAGYVVDTSNKKIKYQAEKTPDGTTDATKPTAIVTITDLKSGLSTDARDNIDGITVDNDNNQIVLSKKVLGTDSSKTLTLTNGKTLEGKTATYTLALNGESFGREANSVIDNTTVKTDATGWEVATSGVATLKDCTTSGYTIDNTKTNKTIKYSAAKLGSTTLAKVENLKSGITVDGEKQIAGITVDKENTEITLSKGVLGTDATKNVKVTNGSYTLALNKTAGDDGYVPAPEYDGGIWTVKSGTATFKETTTEGYKIDDGTDSATKGEVVYLPGKVVTSKITGLNTAVKTDNIKSYITFVGQDNDTDGIGKGVIDVCAEGDNKGKNIGTFTIKKGALVTTKNSTAKLTNDTNYGAYTLELAETDIAKSDATAPKWKKTNKDTKATYTITTQPGLRRSADGLTITNSTTATYEHLATLTGLKKDVAATADGKLAGVSFDANDPETKTILLGPEILATSDVKVTGKTSDGKEYILNLNPTGTNAAADPDNTNNWYEVQYAQPTLSYNKTKGTVSIIGGKTAGWEANRQTAGTDTPSKTEDDVYDKKTIYYTAAAPETLATISGLKFTGNTVTGLAIDDWERTGDNGEANINLTKDSLTTKTVKVTVPDALKDKYTFKLVDISGNIPKPKDTIKFWTSDGKGNVTYRYKTSEGYTLNEKADTLTYSTKAITTLAKITGLKNVAKIDSSNETTTSINGITVNDYTLEEGEVKTPGKLVLNSSDILGNKAGNKIKLTSDYYNFDLASGLKTQDIGTPKWYISGTTATLKTYTTAGYALTGTGTTEGKVVEYKNETAATNEIVKITGLKKNLKADKINEDGLLAFDKVTNLIKPDASVLGTGTITLTNGSNSSGTPYTYKFDATEITKPTEQTPVWKFSNGTATLKQTTTAGHTLDDATKTKLTYSPEKTPTVATVKGLNTKLKLTQNGEIGLATGTKTGSKTVYSLIGEAAITFNDTTKVITINEDALNKKTISVSGTVGYKLAFGNLTTNTEKKEATEWTVSGTTGTYKKYDKDYYTLADGKITYTKATKGTTYATVTGLKKNTTAADLNANWDGNATGGVLTLNHKQLGTSTVKIATTLANTENKDGFTLALSTSTASDEVVPLSKVENVSSATSDKNGKAVLKGTVTTGYSLAFGNKSITYLKENKSGQTIATVTGLAAGKSISADANGVITLTEDKLNKKNVTVTTSKGNVDYTLKLAPAVTAPVFDITETTPKEPGWTNPSGTATLKGYVKKAGYTDLDVGKAIIYTKATDTKNKSKTDKTQVYKSIGNLATIKGMTSGKEPSISSDTIVVDGGKTSGNLTVDGGAYKVEVKSNFQNRSITGSAKADNITIAGTGVSVTGGKGNDYIDLGNKNNRFIYSNGDGDDVIANFTAGKDTLQVKSGTPVVGRTSDNNILVKVGSGSIKLLDTANVTELTVIGKNDNTTKTYAIPKSETNSGYLLADNNYSTDAAQLSDIVKADSSSYTPYEFNSSFSLTKEETFTPTTTSNGSSKKK